MAESDRSTGTLTFLYTDLTNTTELFEEIGDDAADRIIIGEIKRCSDIVDAHRGHVWKTMGDSILAYFESAIDGVAAAIEMQQVFAASRNESSPTKVALKVGMHAGEPIRHGDDFTGTAVILTARIGSVADGGQILVSDVVRGLVGSRGGFGFREVQPKSIRGTSRSVRAFEAVWRTGVELASQPNAPGASVPAPSHEAPINYQTAIILFADIVDSTALTARIGDAAFRERALLLDERIRSVVRACSGTPVEGRTLGDGVLAVFASARHAIDAALHCAAAGGEFGLQLHLGIHAGDVIRESDNVYGGAVNIASRISDLTAPDEILVSATVRDLARTSAPVTFEERGELALKGVDEPQRVFGVRAKDA